MSRRDFPGKRPAVRLYFSLYPEGDTRSCALWIMEQYGVKIRTKRISTIRKQLRPNVTILRSEVMSVSKTTDQSNVNGQPNEEATKTKRQLTHGEYYRVCQVLSTHAEEFLEKRYTKSEAQARLKELSGLHIGETTIIDLMESTGVKWKAKRAESRNKKMKNLAIRTLTTALVRLYRKHKEEIPISLLDLYEDETGRRPSKDIEEAKDEE